MESFSMVPIKQQSEQTSLANGLFFIETAHWTESSLTIRSTFRFSKDVFSSYTLRLSDITNISRSMRVRTAWQVLFYTTCSLISFAVTTSGLIAFGLIFVAAWFVTLLVMRVPFWCAEYGLQVVSSKNVVYKFKPLSLKMTRISGTHVIQEKMWPLRFDQQIHSRVFAGKEFVPEVSKLN